MRAALVNLVGGNDTLLPEPRQIDCSSGGREILQAPLEEPAIGETRNRARARGLVGYGNLSHVKRLADNPRRRRGAFNLGNGLQGLKDLRLDSPPGHGRREIAWKR